MDSSNGNKNIGAPSKGRQNITSTVRGFSFWRRVIFALCGVAAGFVNGFLGTGGGIVLVFALGGVSDDSKDAFAISLAAMLPMSAVSAFLYWRQGSIPAGLQLEYLLPAAAGGLLGGYLLGRLEASLVRRIFAGLVIFAGAMMLFR